MNKTNAKELQERIAMEAATSQGLYGEAADTKQLEQAVQLIGKAWNLPIEETAAQLERIRGPRHNDVNPALVNPTGTETLNLIWGLFETSIRLGQEADRKKLYDLAGELEQAFNLDEWITKSEGEEPCMDSIGSITN